MNHIPSDQYSTAAESVECVFCLTNFCFQFFALSYFIPSTHNLCLSLQTAKSCKLFPHPLRDFETKHSLGRVKNCPSNRKCEPKNFSFFCYKATNLPAAPFSQRVFAAQGYSLNRRDSPFTLHGL